jgi:tRNA pseudouridine38-40 synthase
LRAARNIRATLAYDGTDFCGWQRQKGAPTVQEAIEKKLARITGETVSATAAGRTDAGVHATGQVINFRTRGRIPTERVAAALNSLPPYTVVARHPREVPEAFHARYDAVRRTYRYYLLRARSSPFLGRYTCPAAWLDNEGLDRMRAALPALVGEHDFSSFATASETENRVRTVYTAALREKGPLVIVTLAANGFLRGMVRAVVGTLLEIAAGKRDVTEMERILAARDRRAAGETAPARGLFLARVEYSEER